MRSQKSDRGFVSVVHPTYVTPRENARLIAESSAIGDYEDSLGCPGSSFLWVGKNHHLNREEIAELIARLQHWLDTKRLA
jgi:hypothetical protein